jgi:hypothetical protein
MFTALPDVMRYKNPNPLPASDEGAKMYLIRAETAVIEAALATDKIVISLDDNTARKFFSEASVKIDELKDIVWVNPDKVDEEQPIEWLRNGAKVESDRLLMNYSDKKI